MPDVIDKVMNWLQQMGIPSNVITRVSDQPRLVFNYEIKGHPQIFQLQIVASNEWINAKALVAQIGSLHTEERAELFENVLIANWELNEVTYSVDPDQRNLWCETDMPADSTFDNFKVEFTSIPFGIEYFVTKIAPKINFQVTSTAG
ncbi:MAG: hypothetical protein ACFFDT_36325 [Candidatus Hodarchaeota archaeon]